MQELYSIGDTAKIMGISVQTLRNYTNMKLVMPQHIDLETGYRYYSFKQFHYIDRIKYLRSLGMSLAEIAEILQNGKPDKLLVHLEAQKKKLIWELKEMVDRYEDIDWYINYFQYLNHYRIENVPYILHFETRHLMYVDYLSQDTIESVETRLAKLKNKANIPYRRQYGYIIDFHDFLQGEFTPQKYFTYLKDKPTDVTNDKYLHLPAGLYLCLWVTKRTNMKTDLIKKFFSEHPAPSFSIANEYEDSLVEYHYCPYEIQTLIR
ncbi:MerR family transcriptional regulator [Pectinatus cerevisiiphilus]|uniref:DNA-binding transcriptional MerR regulator n=1 Tax=Pectinatus cerevisiiphilus TaxID=86956 RepID=A0A4R3KBQ0_9FIRM|nr:MerR family transcriptional regulator [Pectinatus cerevisiiphilus]TCS80061.1 DNA-binding transcriptional MerR regulator [Pectinatus cerevisiiphilus]